MILAETFKSLQGESTLAGLPCFFIRLAGCNLDCRCCDTLFAKSAGADSFEATIDELVESARSAAVGMVEVTGGEPLLQDDTPQLCSALLDSGFTVLVETNGSLPISRFPPGVRRIMDCKCPSTGEGSSFLFANFAELNSNDEVKFVIADRVDFDYAMGVVVDRGLTEIGCELLFSPAAAVPGFDSTATPAKLAEWMLAANVEARLQLQLHKLIWPGEERAR